MDRGAGAQIGDRVSFSIADVFLPEPSEVLANLTADVEANGVVVEFSDSGTSPRAYAVVRITAQQSVLLPVGSLRILGNDSAR
jgi:hypothetical protein